VQATPRGALSPSRRSNDAKESCNPKTRRARIIAIHRASANASSAAIHLCDAPNGSLIIYEKSRDWVKEKRGMAPKLTNSKVFRVVFCRFDRWPALGNQDPGYALISSRRMVHFHGPSTLPVQLSGVR